MLLTEARRATRVAGGELVPLPEQDRGGWDRDLVAEGHALVRECLVRCERTGVGPGQYQLLAAINAVHTDAPVASATDWGQIATLYARLEAVAPSPIVTLNRAVAVAELDGPEVALAIVDRLPLAVLPPVARRRGPSCCAGSAAATRRGRRTTPRSAWPGTRPSVPTWPGAAASCGPTDRPPGTDQRAPGPTTLGAGTAPV